MSAVRRPFTIGRAAREQPPGEREAGRQPDEQPGDERRCAHLLVQIHGQNRNHCPETQHSYESGADNAPETRPHLSTLTGAGCYSEVVDRTPLPRRRCHPAPRLSRRSWPPGRRPRAPLSAIERLHGSGAQLPHQVGSWRDRSGGLAFRHARLCRSEDQGHRRFRGARPRGRCREAREPAPGRARLCPPRRNPLGEDPLRHRQHRPRREDPARLDPGTPSADGLPATLVPRRHSAAA